MDSVTFLEKLLSIPSPSGREHAVAAFLIEQMVILGYQVYRDGAGNVIGTVGNPDAAKKIVLLGHMDTVQGLIPVQKEGGKLYGRGAVDAKGPLAAFILAAARVASRLNEAQVLVIGVVEEEVHGRGAHHLAGTMLPPDCVIIGEPSGWEGITIGYKGMLSIEYRLVRPTGHGAGQGTPPTQEAVAFWNRLATLAEALNDGQSQRFHTLDPALRNIQTFHDGLKDRVEMSIGLRLPPGSDLPALQRQMMSWRDGAELAFPYNEPPFRAEKNTHLVRSMLKAIRTRAGKPRFKLKTGTSDMNVLGPAWGCPIVAYGPGDSTLDHTPEEHVEIEEYLQGIKVLIEVLQTLSS
jgi:LysW-gamma-L-lysine carboxypeptidase